MYPSPIGTRVVPVFFFTAKAAALVFAVLATYFFIMRGLGLYTEVYLRAFNFLILGGGILLALMRYAKLTRDKIDYFRGIQIGARITLMAVLPFAVLMGLYLRVDKEFMQYLRDNLTVGPYLTPFIAAGAIAVEGVVSGFIATFVFMPYFKKK